MEFQGAVDRMAHGSKVRRHDWHPGRFLVVVDVHGCELIFDTCPELRVVVPWTPSLEQLQATDWETQRYRLGD